MAEKKFDAQVNYGWGLSLNMTGKAPAVAKRIFDTYADALAYANDVNDSAIEGLVLSVVADTNAELNGAYFVQQVGKAAIEADEEKGIEPVDAVAAVLVKLGSADAAAGDTADALQAAKDYADAKVKALAEGAVSANTEAIATLNGDAETDGSVAKAVADEKALREAAEKDITDRLDVIEGEAEGSVKKALADAKTYAEEKVAALDATVSGASAHVSVEIVEEDGKLTTVTVVENNIASADDLANQVSGLTKAINDEADTAREAEAALAGRIKTIEDAPYATTGYVEGIVDGLDATVGSQTVAEGKHVAVEVVEENGKLTAVTVVENDIASAAALTAETKARQEADTAINDKIGNVAEGKTVVEMIEDAQAAAEAAATLLTEKTTGHVTVSGVQDETTGAWTYTIAENDIASASGVSAAISAETEARKAAIEALDSTKTGEGTFVDVTVAQVDGVITSVTVAENDIASAAVLASVKEDVDNFFKDASFAESAKDTLKELQDYITSDVEGAATMTQAIADNKKAIEDEVTRAEAEELRLNNAITAETKARQDAIAALDATVTSEDGTHVAVKVTEVDGVITVVNVTETDIASAAALTAETAAREAADTANANAITAETAAREAADTAINNKIGEVAEGKTVVEMIEDAQATATGYTDSVKAELLGDAANDYNTLGKLEDKIIAAETAAKAAATKLNEKATGFVTVSGVQDTTTGAWTYTIAENDIASASGVSAAIAAEQERAEGKEGELAQAIAAEKERAEGKEGELAQAIAAEVSARTSADDAIKDRLNVLEGVTVTGKDAIVVSESDAKKNKEVSLKLGTQPAEGEAGIVLSQDANGLVAKLQWGTF